MVKNENRLTKGITNQNKNLIFYLNIFGFFIYIFFVFTPAQLNFMMN